MYTSNYLKGTKIKNPNNKHRGKKKLPPAKKMTLEEHLERAKKNSKAIRGDDN